MYEGTLGGSKVCIKRVRVYEDGPQKATKVCYSRRHSPCSPSLTELTDRLPRGRNVETLNTPKYSTAVGYHYHPLPARFTLYVWWRPSGIPQGTP